MVAGFRDSQGLLDPIDGRVHGAESGESEDDILSAAAHDIEEMFLGDPFNVHIEGAGVVNCTGFVHSLVNIVNGNGRDKFLSGELVFSDKLPVDTRDINTGIDQCDQVYGFQGVRRGNQLYRDFHGL